MPTNSLLKLIAHNQKKNLLPQKNFFNTKNINKNAKNKKKSARWAYVVMLDRLFLWERRSDDYSFIC